MRCGLSARRPRGPPRADVHNGERRHINLSSLGCAAGAAHRPRSALPSAPVRSAPYIAYIPRTPHRDCFRVSRRSLAGRRAASRRVAGVSRGVGRAVASSATPVGRRVGPGPLSPYVSMYARSRCCLVSSLCVVVSRVSRHVLNSFNSQKSISLDRGMTWLAFFLYILDMSTNEK